MRLKSWSLEIGYSRAPCLGADQKARGLWERDRKMTALSEGSQPWKTNSFLPVVRHQLNHVTVNSLFIEKQGGSV